ncbi:MAG: glycosyltransferase [Anaerolineales bacterium]|nr:glycosyltransferase [Anaerolineales bacterium]
MSALSLSLCMIVKNEERNLERCLASVQGVVDEIVLVDTGSTDRTVEISEAHGAKIYHHTWQDDFSLARNISLEHACENWVLILDADEELEITTRPLIKPFLSASDADAIRVRVRSFSPPGEYPEYQDSWQVRLFRNKPEYRYEQSVHNQITSSILSAGGKIVQVDTLTWLHYGYMERNVQGGNDRYQRSLKMLEQAVAQSPKSAYLNAKLGILYYHLGNHPLAYSYLKRLFTELDTSQLDIESLINALVALALVALNQQHYDLAIRSAQSCIELTLDDTSTLLFVKGLLARAYAEQGKHYLQATEQNLARSGDDARIMAGFRPDHLQQGLQFLRQARQQYEQLQQQPGLKPEMRDKIISDLNLCQDMIAGVEDFLASYIGALSNDTGNS